MIFKEFTRWVSDDKPKTTPAIVVVSECGEIVKRLPYRKWNKKNNGYNNMKEYVYIQSSNRGKQRFEDKEKIEKHGMYRHVEINGKIYQVHRIVAKAFIPNKDNLPCVNHIDGVRDNNHYSNLEWVTNKDNVEHAWSTGLRSTERMKKLSDDAMTDVMRMKREGMSNPKIGKVFGVTGETIRIRVKDYENSNGCKK